MPVGWNTGLGRKPHGGWDPTFRKSSWLIFASGSLLTLRNCALNTGSCSWIHCLSLSITSSLVMLLLSPVLSLVSWVLKSQVDSADVTSEVDKHAHEVELPFREAAEPGLQFSSTVSVEGLAAQARGLVIKGSAVFTIMSST